MAYLSEKLGPAGGFHLFAGAGETVLKAPVLERIGRRPVPPLDIGEDLDGGGESGGGCHQMPRRMRRINITHMMLSTTALRMKARPRRLT